MTTPLTFPTSIPSAYREIKKETLVHVGYNITLTDEILDEIKALFAGLVPENLHLGPYNTAVLHISQEAKQEDLHLWYRKASKNTNDEARVRSIYHKLTFTFDKVTKAPKSCRGMIALYITVGANHLYLNVFNNTDVRPFAVKKLVNSGEFSEIKMTKSVPITAVAYKSE